MNEELDILGQLPLLKIYTQICCCFSIPNPSSHEAIVDTLRRGLHRLSTGFPWVAGQVVNEGAGEGDSGIFRIKSLEKNPRLVVKDLRHTPGMPTMDDLRRSNFPMSMLDEAIIAPRKTLPGSFEESAIDSNPVFLLQANFITGGLLLTFVGQHNTMDMTGQGQIIHLLSKACRNEEFTSEELSCGNLARRYLVPLLDNSYIPGPELARQIVKPTQSHQVSNDRNGHTAPRLPPQCTWVYVSFTPASLTALKALASETVTTAYISTDDALSAFIWQSVTRSRLHRLHPTADTTFARAVNVRPYLGIPPTYPGLVQNMTYHTYTVQMLVEEPLGGLASRLRSAVDLKTSKLGYNTRALATFLDRTPDKHVVHFAATLDLSKDIMLSSWAKVDCYNLDFNLGLGKPESVRRPRFDPFESLIYLMPRSLDGEIAVALCLRDEDMERLRVDSDFVKYAKFIG